MLPLEKECVSLELAQRLTELGVKQERYFYWVCAGGEGKHETWGIEHISPQFPKYG